MTRTECYVEEFLRLNTPNVMWHEDAMLEEDLRLAESVEAVGAAALTRHEKRAFYECRVLDTLPISVNDFELLAGRKDIPVLTEAERTKVEAFRPFLDAALKSGFDNNQTNHRVVDYEKLLSIGISGILAEIDGYLSALTPDMPDFVEKRSFYLSGRRSLEAVLRLAERYRGILLEKAKTVSEPRASELLTMADILSRVPYGPAETFYEALQSLWLVQFCLCTVNDISLTGRFDQYMYPFYAKDLAAGRITKEFAFELIEQLYIKHNELYAEWPAAIMVGGVDWDGHPVLNDLSYLCIEAIGTVKLVNPAVNVAWRPDLPEDFLDLCLKQLADGRTRPAFFNDALIQEGLQLAGVSQRDARVYIHSTCVEITPVAASGVMVATPYVNLNKAFEYMFGEGKAIFGAPCPMERDVYVPLSELKTFEAFKAQAYRCAAEIIRYQLTETLELCYRRAHDNASPLASTLIRDCLSLGLDVGCGGARYEMIYPCFPGFINFIDTLAAVRKAVYEDKTVTLSQLGDAMRDNFTNESLRQYLLNACPKFGNDDKAADLLGEEVYAFIREELGKYTTVNGSKFYPSFFAWIMHGRLGSQASALPDGRKQGEALSEHLGAMQGRDKKGPLAVVHSISRIPQEHGIGGIATNFRFSVDFMHRPEGLAALKAFIRGFMEKRCFEMQFNVVSQAQLLDALDHPEQYRTLLVRIAGYSDYFVNLDPVIQQEILKRMEHDSL